MSRPTWDTLRLGAWGRTRSWTASATGAGTPSRRRVTKDALAASSTPHRSMTSVGLKPMSIRALPRSMICPARLRDTPRRAESRQVVLNRRSSNPTTGETAPSGPH